MYYLTIIDESNWALYKHTNSDLGVEFSVIKSHLSMPPGDASLIFARLMRDPEGSGHTTYLVQADTDEDATRQASEIICSR